MNGAEHDLKYPEPRPLTLDYRDRRQVVLLRLLFVHDPAQVIHGYVPVVHFIQRFQVPYSSQDDQAHEQHHQRSNAEQFEQLE